MYHSSLFVSNITVSQISVKTHRGILLDTNLTLSSHIKDIIKKTNEIMRLFRKFRNVLPRPAYKAFVKPYLEHGDIAFDKA